MQRRLGFIGIIVEDREKVSVTLNKILSEYGDHIVARMGLPYKEKQCSVITLIVDMTTDEMGSLTGKIGSVEGVSVKSALAKGKRGAA